jgi:hypothetical protein
MLKQIILKFYFMKAWNPEQMTARLDLTNLLSFGSDEGDQLRFSVLSYNKADKHVSQIKESGNISVKISEWRAS